MTAPDSPSRSLSAAVGTGTRLDALKAQRADLAARLDACDSDRDAASLHLRLMDVLDRIDAAEKAEPEKTGTALDELAKRRRTAGRPDASGDARAAGSPNRR